MAPLLEIKYVRSAIGRPPDQRRTVAALGLRKINDTVRLADNASVRGMIHKVRHLVTATSVGDEANVSSKGS